MKKKPFVHPCDDYYYYSYGVGSSKIVRRDNNTFTTNCKCQNGKAVTGSKCRIHDQENCDPSKCNKGFHYEANHCVKNICKCQHGRLAANCEKHESNSCEIGSCEEGFYMTEESKKSASPECKALFKGKDYQSVGSTGVYFLYEPSWNYNLKSAHQFCKNLNANLGTIRDRVELGVIKSLVTNDAWVDVSSSKQSSNRARWYWGNNQSW